MPSIRKAIARKAVKTTARHTARGAASKLQRNPFRAVTLLGAGFLAGIATGAALRRPSRSTSAST